MFIYHNCHNVKRSVVSVCLKSSKLLIVDLMFSGKPFQSLGTTAQNALLPYHVVLVRGITNKYLDLDHSVSVGVY